MTITMMIYPLLMTEEKNSYQMDHSGGDAGGKRGLIGPKIEENRRFLHVLVIYSYIIMV